MKKLLFALVCLILMALGSVFIWLQFPFIEDPDYVEAVMTEEDQWFSSLQAQAANPIANGWLHPEMRAYWARPNNNRGDSPLTHAILNWEEQSLLMDFTDTTHEELWGRREEGYVAAFDDFYAHIDAIKDCLSRDVLLPESLAGTNRFTNSSPNVSPKREKVLGLCLIDAARALHVQGRDSEAAEVLTLCWRLGSRLTLHDIDSFEVGILLHQEANWAFYHCFSPNSKLDSKSWLVLAEGIGEAKLAPQSFERMLQYELSDSIRQGEFFIQQQQGTPILDWWLRANLGKELRRDKNLMTSLLKAHNPDAPLTLPPALQASGMGASSRFYFLPWGIDQLTTLNVDALALRTELAGLATCAGLFAYRAEHGRLPKTLEALRLMDLQNEYLMPWSQMDYRPPEKLIVPWISPQAQTRLPSKTWVTATPEGLEFQLTGAGE